MRDLSDCAAAYLDIFSQSWENHMDQMLQKTQAAGLSIDPHKSALYCPKRRGVLALYVTGFGEIKPQLGKVEDIQTFPAPTTKKKLKEFLSLVSCYHKFVPQFVLTNRDVLLSQHDRCDWLCY